VSGSPGPGADPGHEVRAFLGLGSNVGDSEGHLRRAVSGLPDLVAVSPVYRTEPIGGPPGQEDYLNLVAELDTELTPWELLEVAHRLEQEAGRVRTVRNGPRTLDVDVLLVGEMVIDEPDLVVPIHGCGSAVSWSSRWPIWRPISSPRR